MPSQLRFIAVAAALLALALVPPAAARAATPATVHASPAEVSRLLFVAGDARRLGRNPSGTVDTVLEQVLQAEYRLDPSLDPADAAADIDGLRAAVGSGDTSPATLAVVPGNQRVLAILAAFEGAPSAPRVKRALARVADRALTESSGTTFDAGADTLSTLLYGSFSPAATLKATAELAAGDPAFGRARDRLWAPAAHESVFAGADALIAANPALQTDAIRALLARRDAGGGLTADVADLEATVRDGLQTVGAQTTTALDDHQQVVRTCPGQFCDFYRDRAKADGAAGRGTIADQQASLTATSELLAQANAAYADALLAETQGAAQVASAVNAYYAAADYGEYVQTASDAAGLVLALAAVEVDPAAAVTGVIDVVGDIVGVSVQGPDANQLILQGLQGVSNQLSAFATATAAQFRAVDARLEALTRQVSDLAHDLSSQLADARMQLMTLDDRLSTLQSSVDRLQSEIHTLFATQARTDLRTVIAQSVGYAARNPAGLSAERFADAAEALFSNADDTASEPTVAIPPSALDATAASGITALNPNLNFFAGFPDGVRDSVTGIDWPRALGAGLPDPDFWAEASRAYAQVLLENRANVVAGRLPQIDRLLAKGHALAGALGRITQPDDGDRGTGSRLFNAALDYYRSWADGDRAGAPSLLQALRAERARYLSLVPGLPEPGRTVDLYGGPSQAPGDVGGLDAFQALKNAALPGFTLPDATPAPALFTSLPAPIRNALRLDAGSLSLRWDASFEGPVQRGQHGTLDVEFSYTFAAGGRSFGLDTLRVSIPNAIDCAGQGDANDGVRTVQASWAFDAPGSCPEVAFAVQTAATNRSGANDAAAAAYAAPLVDARLRELQDGFYADLLTSGGKLTQGSGDATDVAAAAQRLGGAQALVNGYVTLGLPQALTTDDGLHSLIAGDAANALAAPFGDDRRAEPADTVPGQVASFFRFERDARPQTDPLTTLGLLLNRHRLALQDAIAPYIKTRHGAVDMGPLDETSPLVGATLVRLALTKAVLEDRLAHPAVAPQSPAAPQPTVAPAPPAQPSPASQVGGARARVIHAARVHGRTIRLTVGCATGSCRLTVTAVSGRRSVARPVRLRLRAGARRTLVLRLNAAGRRQLARHKRLRVTVKVAQAGRKRPLSVARVTVR